MKYKGFTYTPTPKTAWDNLSMLEKSEMMKIAVRNGITDLKTIKEKYNKFADGGDTNPYTVGATVDALYASNPREEFLGEPSHHYDFTQSEEWANEHGYYPDVRGHRDDRVKKPTHPSHPSRGTWNGDKFELTDLGMQNPNYTLFGLNDGGQDPQAVLTYQGGIVLPEITVTPNENYFYNPYDNIILHQKANGGKIHIKSSKKGTFTAAATKHGMGVQEFASKVLANKDDYSPAMVKKANFARNASKWHGEGGNLFDGASQPTQKMQIGLNVQGWPDYTTQQIIAYGEENKRRKKAIQDAYLNFVTESNDATIVANGRPHNQHLVDRAVRGAKANAAWEKEHPVLNTIGTALGAAPFTVAATPLLAAVGEAAAPVLANPYVDAALTSGFSTHGLNHAINEGIDDWGDAAMTALEVAPLGRLVKPMYGQTSKWVATSQNPNMQYVRYGLGKAKGFLEGNAPQLPRLYRKVKGIPTIEGGKVVLSTPENRFAFENGMGQESPLITNFTTDVGVRRHADGNWNWAPTLSFPGETLLGKRVVSTRPSDTFTYGDVISVPLNRVTAVTGRGKEIDAFENMGLNVLSSTDVQSAFANDLTSYVSKAQKLRANNAKILKAKAEGKPTFKRKWPEKDFDNYASEIQQLTRRNFRSPTVKDYEFMDYVFNPQYSSEVVPKLSLEEAVVKYPSLVGSWYGYSGRRRYIANPDEWVNVIYDPYSPVEDLFRESKGIGLKPKWQNK